MGAIRRTKLTDLSNKLTPVMCRRILAHIRANYPGYWLATVRWTTLIEVVDSNGAPSVAPYPTQAGFIVACHKPADDSKFTLFIQQ